MPDLHTELAAAIMANIGSMVEDYDEMYGALDYSGRVVADVGGANGATVVYFLSRGAKKVIVYELNPFLVEQIKMSFSSNPAVEIHAGGWDGGTLPAEADVLKMDCEGCEKALLAKPGMISRFDQWVVAIHKEPLAPKSQFDAPQALLAIKNGGAFTYRTPDDAEYVYVKTTKN